jgi:hypothetical protein
MKQKNKARHLCGATRGWAILRSPIPRRPWSAERLFQDDRGSPFPDGRGASIWDGHRAPTASGYGAPTSDGLLHPHGAKLLFWAAIGLSFRTGSYFRTASALAVGYLFLQHRWPDRARCVWINPLARAGGVLLRRGGDARHLRAKKVERGEGVRGEGVGGSRERREGRRLRLTVQEWQGRGWRWQLGEVRAWGVGDSRRLEEVQRYSERARASHLSVTLTPFPTTAPRFSPIARPFPPRHALFSYTPVWLVPRMRFVFFFLALPFLFRGPHRRGRRRRISFVQRFHRRNL